ncbi:OST-HTH/LOTUS domain-containing protein, partial [Xanthomonas perforans]|nr:OST-HTH/LOTUS domain-containing protein [Xanthomonas perforans]
AIALRSDTRLVQMLRKAIVSACEDDGWALLSAVGKQVANQASFDPRNYGYRKLSDLVRAIGLFEIRQDEQALWVRDAPKGGGSGAKTAVPAAVPAAAAPSPANKRAARAPAKPAPGK